MQENCISSYKIKVRRKDKISPKRQDGRQEEKGAAPVNQGRQAAQKQGSTIRHTADDRLEAAIPPATMIAAASSDRADS